MKAKKIIIIALSALVVALIVALVSVSIAAGNENLSIAEYFAKIAKNEKLDESTLVIINGEEKSIESFEKLIRVYSALDAVFDSEKLENEFNQFVDAQLLTQEAQRRGITANRDEIQEQLDYQKESFLLALEGGDEIAKMFVDIYKGLGMTVEEYYASDEAYQYYYDLMCMNTLQTGSGAKGHYRRGSADITFDASERFCQDRGESGKAESSQERSRRGGCKDRRKTGRKIRRCDRIEFQWAA